MFSTSAVCPFSKTWNSSLSNSTAMPFSIRVTLTSVRDPTDQRHLTLKQGDPTHIGRASKAESKNLSPSHTNALFDCPVISRMHAELRVNPWAPAGDQVTLTDKDSMHGTQVNGRRLERFKPMSLRSGDLVEFGTRVTRGLDTHEGIVVTFDRIVQDSQNSYTLAGSSLAANRRYEVPDISDDEDSLSEEDIFVGSDLSDAGDDDEPSSAKTTPEHAKSQPGSASFPIDIEDAGPPPSNWRSAVINLDDDDEPPLAEKVFERGSSESYRPKSPTLQSLPDPRSDRLTIAKLVQNSADKDASLSVPESVPAGLARAQSDDAWSVLNHSVTAGGLNERVTSPAPDDASMDEHDNVSEYDQDIEPQEHDYDIDDGDVGSDSDASELSTHAANLDANTYSATKQASPELGSAIPSKQGLSSTAGSQQPRLSWSQYPSQYSTAPHYTTSQAYFDPVRASQPRNTPCSYPAASHSLYQPYTYGVPVGPGPYSSYLNGYTDIPSSSRWDVPPAAPLQERSNNTSGGISYGSLDTPYTATTPYSNIHQPPFQYGVALDWAHGQTRSVPRAYPTTQAVPCASQQPTLEPTSQPSHTSKSTMPIADMLAAASKAEEDANAVEGDNLLAAPAKKRKADDISTHDLEVTSESFEPLNAPEVPLSVIRNLFDNQEPPARRRKLEEASTTAASRKIASDVAKYTAAAMVGGASTVAFLCSPLAERLLEWLA